VGAGSPGDAGVGSAGKAGVGSAGDAGAGLAGGPSAAPSAAGGGDGDRRGVSTVDVSSS